MANLIIRRGIRANIQHHGYGMVIPREKGDIEYCIAFRYREWLTYHVPLYGTSYRNYTIIITIALSECGRQLSYSPYGTLYCNNISLCYVHIEAF